MADIVILQGSVRKNGNTQRLAQEFLRGASENNNVKMISIGAYNINPCTGCNSCFERDGHKCFQNDDMSKIYELLMKADILVVASPVYFYGISAQLKALVDRLHTPMRHEFNVKKMALFLVGAATLPDMFEPINLQYELILRFFKLEDIGRIFVDGVKDIGDIKGNKALDDAYKLGLSIR